MIEGHQHQSILGICSKLDIVGIIWEILIFYVRKTLNYVLRAIIYYGSNGLKRKNIKSLSSFKTMTCKKDMSAAVEACRGGGGGC